MRTRRIETAELLAVGSELTQGQTRDTNMGDLARELSSRGVRVTSMTALPDDLQAVREAVSRALARADLLVTTGGLGPTPDDLTREAIAAACGLEPREDPGLVAWLRELFERRGLAMSEANRKQAWVIDGGRALENPNGTAPGWWVDRPEGQVIVALPGPPREMAPMWRDHVLPKLLARGLGLDRAARTLRLTGIGESSLVELIGEDVLRAANPEVATYARPDAVDVRVTATAAAGIGAATLVERTLVELEPRLAEFLFARDEETWSDALARRLAGRQLACVEIGTAGHLAALLGGAPFLAFSELLGPETALARAHQHLSSHAKHARKVAGTEVALAVHAQDHAGDTAVQVAIATGAEIQEVSLTAFLGGDEGRRRAAIAAVAELWRTLGRPAASIVTGSLR